MSEEQLELVLPPPAAGPPPAAPPAAPRAAEPSDALPPAGPPPAAPRRAAATFAAELERFREFGKPTRVAAFPDPSVDLPVFVNEFWTAKQRAASPIHEVSYRACFKPQLPRFFIDRLTEPGEVVYDPFMGRGTTLVEAALLDRIPAGCDINPLSTILVEPRLDPPSIAEVAARLDELSLDGPPPDPTDELLVFYHPDTLRQLTALRDHLLARAAAGTLDRIDAWIRMVATNRLTGHSSGFFSVYTLPPNQATSVRAQLRINAKRNQTPPPRDVRAIILKKSRSLLRRVPDADLRRLRAMGEHRLLLTGSCDDTPEIPDGAVSLVVTSPPFLDVVDYQGDNWLRCWFNGFDASTVPVWKLRRERDWTAAMTSAFREFRRILVPGGHVAFEVGEVRGGRLLMETLVVPAATEAGLTPELVLVNDQIFTKTANCWGVDNLAKGTNTNRVVLLRKDAP